MMMHENKPFLSLIFSFAMTAFLLPHLGQLAAKIGLVDLPNKRKIHRNPKPLVGGLAMSLAVALAGLLFIPLMNLRGFYAGLILLVIVGFLDDFSDLNHRYKFAAQIIAALFIMYFSRVYLYSFGNLLGTGSIDFHMLTVPMTIIGVVGVCNAINMIDGLDGLAGGICLMVFGTFAGISLIMNRPVILLLSMCICGSLVAFLIYNWHPSKLFMGDAGSLFLGFAAAFISIVLTQKQNSFISSPLQPLNVAHPVVPLLVLAVPIVDTLTIMTRRLLKGKNPFRADRGHLHHILLRMGYSKRQTAAFIILLSGCFSAIAVAGVVLQTPDHYLFFIFIGYFLVSFTTSFYVKRMIRNREKLSMSFINSLF